VLTIAVCVAVKPCMNACVHESMQERTTFYSIVRERVNACMRSGVSL